MFGTNNYSNQNQFGAYPQQGYQPQQRPRMNTAQMLDQIDSQSSKGAKFENPGDTVSGIIENVSAAQVNVYDSVNQKPTNQPDYWNDGSPKLQVLVTVDTGMRDPTVEDDDGRRTIYIKGWGGQRRAWIEAIRRAGIRKASEIKPGDRFTAKFVGYDPQSKNPNNPAKMYEYTIDHASPIDQAMGSTSTMTQQIAPSSSYRQPARPQVGQYQPQQPQTFQQPQQAPQAAPYQQPQVGQYQQPQPQMTQQPQQQAQAASYRQPMQPQQAVPTQQILQLKAIGKPPQEIAGLLGIPVEQVTRVTDAANPQMHAGSEDEPEF